MNWKKPNQPLDFILPLVTKWGAFCWINFFLIKQNPQYNGKKCMKKSDICRRAVFCWKYLKSLRLSFWVHKLNSRLRWTGLAVRMWSRAAKGRSHFIAGKRALLQGQQTGSAEGGDWLQWVVHAVARMSQDGFWRGGGTDAVQSLRSWGCSHERFCTHSPSIPGGGLRHLKMGSVSSYCAQVAIPSQLQITLVKGTTKTPWALTGIDTIGSDCEFREESLFLLSLHREGPGRYKGFLHATAVQLSDSNPRGNQTTKEEIHCSSAEGENPLILKFTWQCQRHIAIRPFKLCHLHIRAGDLCLRRLQLCLERGKTPAEPHDTRRRSVVPPALLSSPVDEKAGGGCSFHAGKRCWLRGVPAARRASPWGDGERGPARGTGTFRTGGAGSWLVCKASFKMDFIVN